MQPNTAKITIVFSLSAIILFGGGCVLFQPKNNARRQQSVANVSAPGSENIIANAFYLPMAPADIQTFLNSQPGILKNYQEQNYSQTFSGAEIIDSAANDSLRGLLNPRILLVLLEFKKNVITNSNLQASDLKNLFGLSSERVERLNARIFLGGEYWTEFPDAWQNLLLQLTAAAETLRQYPANISIVSFRDGTTSTLPNTLNEETKRLEALLAELADTPAQWRRWISKEPGSFYEVYKRWFGNPVKEITTLTATSTSADTISPTYLNQDYRSSKLYYDFGTLELSGYLAIQKFTCDPEIEPMCEGNTDYAFFVITNSSNKSNFYDFLKAGGYYPLIQSDRIGIGCYQEKEQKIHSVNTSDLDWVTSVIGGDEFKKLVASDKEHPVRLRLTRPIFSGGSGAPECYSHFRYFKVW
ncbi:MAG: hypothetical protein HYV42_03210 [Candidatus Magasanikbacteria bacterium]|nr:hypothetical protein [Candidatus Magasanikbacteria bacterium]